MPVTARLSWPALSVGAMGVAAIIGMAVSGLADGIAASGLASLLFAATLATAWWSRERQAARVVPNETPRIVPAYVPPYAHILDALPDPVLVITGDEPDDLAGRRYVLANRAARETLRLQNETGLLVTVIRAPDVLEAVDEALFGQVDSQVAYETGGAQGRVLMAFARPLAAPAGAARQALLVLRDETDLRRAERMRADFLANASHELRTPLASLTGFIETLRGHARADEAARDKFLAIMQTQADRMSRLIDDLMSLSRIELNEHIPPQGEVDLTMAVMDVVDAVGPLARERDVELKIDLPPKGEVIVVGDRDQIVQVAQNLIDNALKYSPSGSAVQVSLASGLSADAAAAARSPLSARLSLLAPDRGRELYAALRVRDFGVGLAREHLPRLTERFYRVEGQKSGERPGTGLGLAIVKHIMNRHRGGLAVESAEGEGATFTVFFPLIGDGVIKLS
jgi:two-component system, OmpR family, phosphate regulon sensor histidine kinase PhoR